MPALAAAIARLMPPSALAIANRRRATRASASALASLRSTAGVRSLRIFSFFTADPVSRIVVTRQSRTSAPENRSTATRVSHCARRYNTRRVRTPSMLDPHVATIESRLAAEPQVTGLAIVG
jgi:hypothetical protein